MLDGTDIVYVARAASRRIMTVGITVGTRFPAFATSMGRVLLADLSPDDIDTYFARADLTPPAERARHTETELRSILAATAAQGWAEVDSELEAGLYSLAAPIRGRSGRVVAAVNVSTPSAARPDGLRERVLETAAAVGADLQRTALT